MHVIGTAGHVDHGKSSLVKALTGIDPDRLKEEKQRQMTVDLGFAWLALPSGQEVGIVDVPGHRDFMENMLAGLPGVDLALLVIALDEGVMPQTREHLAVLNLLGIKSGIIVLTKADLVNDSQWEEMVISDVRKLVSRTFLEKAPIQPISVKTRAGIDDLINLIDKCVNALPERRDLSKPRLSVDRVFSLAGFGTIVTGTLLDGRFLEGEDVEILPSALKSRIRGLQTYKQKEEIALPGSRTAINLAGLAVSQLGRGDVIVHPGTYQSSDILNADFQLLMDSSVPLNHNEEIKLFIGTAEVYGKVRTIDRKEIKPGDRTQIQMELSQQVVALHGDRFILRQPSPALTLGGGEIIDIQAKRWSRKASTILVNGLNITEVDIQSSELLQFLQKNNVRSFAQIRNHLRIRDEDLINLIFNETKVNRIVSIETIETVPFERRSFIETGILNNLIEKIISVLSKYYRDNELRLGIKKEELRSNLPLSQAEFEMILKYLAAKNKIVLNNGLVISPSRHVIFSPKQEHAISEMLKGFDLSPFEPPSVEECQKMVGKEVYQSLLDQQLLLQVSSDVVFKSDTFTQAESRMTAILKQSGRITLAEIRDEFHTSRKFALAMLEHLDRKGITVREGDYRKFKNG